MQNTKYRIQNTKKITKYSGQVERGPIQQSCCNSQKCYRCGRRSATVGENKKNVKVVLRLNSQQKDQETMYDKIVLTSKTEEISIG